MEMTRYSIAMAVAGGATLVIASLLVWLVVTEPVALATAIDQQDLSELAEAIGRALVAGFQAIVEYL